MNNQLITGTPTTSDVYYCGKCGGMALDLPQLAGGIAKCRSCKWEGPSTELICHTFQHTLGSDDDLLVKFMRELRLMMAKDFSQPLGVFLYRWGFLAENEGNKNLVNPEQLKRYLTAFFFAGAKAIIETREEIEKERTHGRSS